MRVYVSVYVSISAYIAKIVSTQPTTQDAQTGVVEEGDDEDCK